MRDMIFGVDGAAQSPEAAAQKHMRPVLPKKFYKNVTTDRIDDSYQILLDGRPVKTPAKSRLLLPTEAAAKLVAAEWDAQKSVINPALMHATRLANTAIDGIASEPQAVLEDLLRFASNDMLFYRASHPDTLVALQCKHWDPVLDWVAKATGARFETTGTIMHIVQPREAMALFSQRMGVYDDHYKLACLHTITSLTGSALLAYAIAERHMSPHDAWQAAHVDEDFNISKWGEDFEAGKRRKLRLAEMTSACELFRALDD
jgi:chaperone required for assembly of F1-ATPase